MNNEKKNPVGRPAIGRGRNVRLPDELRDAIEATGSKLADFLRESAEYRLAHPEQVAKWLSKQQK